MKIALVQMSSVFGDYDENIRRTEYWIKESLRQGAEVVAFPELSLSGYFASLDGAPAFLDRDHPYVLATAALSKTSGVTLLVGFPELLDGGRYIAHAVVSNGELVDVYHKRNIEGDEAKVYSPGLRPCIFEAGGHKIGVCICADLGCAEYFKEYAELGCDIVLECASPDLYGSRETRDWEQGFQWWRSGCFENVGTYAKDYNIWVGVATQAGGNSQHDFPGGGYLFSPDGSCSAESADRGEGVLVVDVA